MEYFDIILPIVAAVIGWIVGRGWPLLKGFAASTPTQLDDQLIAAVEKAVRDAVRQTPLVQVAETPAALVKPVE